MHVKTLSKRQMLHFISAYRVVRYVQYMVMFLIAISDDKMELAFHNFQDS